MPEATLAMIFGTSWLVGLSGAVSPGPVLALDIRESVRRGPWAGPAIALGHALLELLMVVALYVGLAQFLSGGPVVVAVALLGGAFLLWMAWRMLRHPGHGAPSAAQAVAATGRGHRLGPVVGGVLVSLANPFWTIWWATIGLAYLLWARELGLLGLGAFYVGHILADLSWFSAVSVAVGSGRRLMTDAVYKGVMLACGVFLGGMGVYFVARGVSLLGVS